MDGLAAPEFGYKGIRGLYLSDKERPINQVLFSRDGLFLAYLKEEPRNLKIDQEGLEILNTQKGFSIIELLIVIAIIGIIAAIAIPNLLNAIQRGKQKRTMADMRSIATAIESYAVDNDQYPQLGGSQTVVDLRPFLETTYIKRVPTQDAWQTNIDFISSLTAQEYSLRSRGKNRGAEVAMIPPGPTQNFDNDIWYSVGNFTQYPEGSQAE